MATTINIAYQKKNYTLEFSRQTVKTLEDMGFVLEQISEKPMTMVPLLVYGAFMKHNRGIKRALVNIHTQLSTPRRLPLQVSGLWLR